MKKNLLWATFAVALAATSCTNDEYLSQNEPKLENEISFKTFAPMSLRGLDVSTAADMQPHSFDVFAYKVDDGQQFMGNNTSDGIEIGYTVGSGWDYATASEKTLWTAEPVNFYAVWPETYDNLVKTIGKADQSATFTVPTDASKHIDLMYASVLGAHINNRNGATGNETAQTTGAVPLVFKHMLAQVAFKIESANKDIEVEVKDITIHNVYTSGKIDLANGTWSNLSNMSTHTTTLSGATTGDNSLIVLPQSFTGWTLDPNNKDVLPTPSEKESYMKLNCTIKNTKGGDSYLYGADNAPEYIYIPFSGTWTMGNLYTYTLTFVKDGSTSGGGGYDEEGEPILKDLYISFTPSVETWTEISSGVEM